MQQILLEKSSEAPAGGGNPPSTVIDPGAPFVHGDDEAKPKETAKPAEKSPDQKRIEALEADLAATNKRMEEITASERYWANRAQGQQDDDDDEPAPAAARVPEPEEKPEKFLDDLSVKGLRALKEKGVITQEQLEDRLQEIEDRIDGKLALQQKHNQIDSELNKFPELRDQRSPLFQKAQVHFRAMVADDAAMKDSPAALLAAVRMARKEIDLEKEADTNGNRGDGRRARIERQMGERPPAGGSEADDHPDPLSPTARQVVQNLSRFGVNEESVRKFARVK